MKHVPRPAIHMEKPLLTDEWACKLGGMEPQGISRMGQTVLARLMEYQIWHQPVGFVSLLGEGSPKGQWPLPAFLFGKKLSSSTRLDAGYFNSSLDATDAF